MDDVIRFVKLSRVYRYETIVKRDRYSAFLIAVSCLEKNFAKKYLAAAELIELHLSHRSPFGKILKKILIIKFIEVKEKNIFRCVI